MMTALTTAHRRRRRTLAALLALAPLAAACSDRDPVSPLQAPGLGVVEGAWDGAAWRGYGYAVLQEGTLRLVGHRPDPELHYDEFVRVSVPYRGVAVYDVPADAGQLAQIVGGDAGWFPQSSGELRVTATETLAPSAEEPAVARVRGEVELASTREGLPWRFAGSFDVPVYARWEDVPAPPERQRPN